MEKPIRRLALIVNETNTCAPEHAGVLRGFAEQLGAKVSQSGAYPIPTGLLTDQDARCVIGGDGTLLGVGDEAARANIPIIGVNRGSLGFLTTFSAEEARTYFPTLLAGDYCIAE